MLFIYYWLSYFKAMCCGGSKKRYPRIAQEDLIVDGSIYALPFYIDTLALYYNEDMFLNEKYLKPPETWDEFKDYVERLTYLDKDGNIIRAGAAFGGGSNVNRSQDIVMLMVMQNNIRDVGVKDIVSFSNENSIDAVEFYTSFTDPDKRFYTWNENQIYSIDAFVNRKAAMMINYSYHIGNIREKSGNTLNFKIAPIPQVTKKDKVNYASYWIPVVSKELSLCMDYKDYEEIEGRVDLNCNRLAWEFLEFAAREENVVSYLDSVQRPAANLSLAKKQYLDFSDTRSVFADQVFTARSWEQDAKSDEVLEEMINSIVTNNEENRKSVKEAMESAMKKYKPLAGASEEDEEVSNKNENK